MFNDHDILSYTTFGNVVADYKPHGFTNFDASSKSYKLVLKVVAES